ncbi:MAG TPA: polysaccharide biosynthesis tyrosine autokinase, partial [Longimicrobiaceae bacterium]|nr:polysaccharide biosynthesis tyrosine autokinase [Longimicrobiaceae bacterium]
SSLVQLENEKGELLTRRNPNDPDVMALDERIGQIERQLHSIASTQQQSLSGQIASLNSSLGRESGSLSEMPRKQVEMARRQRETALLEEVYTLLQTRLKEAEIAQAVEDPSARIVDRANGRSGPIEPRTRRNLLMALVVGLALGFGSAYLREHLDKTVHSKADVQLLTGVPVLGLVPRFEEGEGNGRGSRLTRMLPGKRGNGSPRARGRALVQRDPRSVINEAFRTLRTNINFAAAENLPRTLLLTSALPRDGKTTTSVNLAHAFAHQGLRVLVVDADMRRGTIHQMFQIGRDPGLSNVLVGDGRVEDAIREVETAPGVDLHVLTTGTIPPNPTELLASARMRWLVEHLAQQYDQVILDSPPLTLVADAAVLAPHMDSVLVVVRAGYTEEAALTYTMDQLRHVGAPVRGTILNDVDVRDRRYGGYQYYGYRYDYYSAEDSAG